jgi:hypothetical protein
VQRCEVEVNALTNAVLDSERSGCTSWPPKGTGHAAVNGPVTRGSCPP